MRASIQAPQMARRAGSAAMRRAPASRPPRAASSVARRGRLEGAADARDQQRRQRERGDVDDEDGIRADRRHARAARQGAGEEAERPPAHEPGVRRGERVVGDEVGQRAARGGPEGRLDGAGERDEGDQQPLRAADEVAADDAGAREVGADHHAATVEAVGQPGRERGAGEVAELGGEHRSGDPLRRARLLPEHERDGDGGGLAAEDRDAAADAEQAHRGAPRGEGRGVHVVALLGVGRARRRWRRWPGRGPSPPSGRGP